MINSENGKNFEYLRICVKIDYDYSFTIRFIFLFASVISSLISPT